MKTIQTNEYKIIFTFLIVSHTIGRSITLNIFCHSATLPKVICLLKFIHSFIFEISLSFK